MAYDNSGSKLQDVVMRALLAGHSTREAISLQTGLVDRQVHGVLVGLALAGRVELQAGAWRAAEMGDSVHAAK